MSHLPDSVQLATGACILRSSSDLDFVLDGIMPLHWQRVYASANAHPGSNSYLGPGWTSPLSYALEVADDKLYFVDLQGRRTQFPALEIGAGFFSPYELTHLQRTGPSQYELMLPSGIQLGFAARPSLHFSSPLEPRPEGTGAAAQIGTPRQRHLPLQHITDRHRNGFSIEYDRLGLPVQLVCTSGDRLQLRFDHSSAGAARLRSIILLTEASDHSRLGLSPAQQLLVQYQYSAAGDLVAVLDAEQQVCRQFEYHQHMLVAEHDISGQSTRYLWSEHRPTGQVMRVEASSGRHWSLHYTTVDTTLHSADAPNACAYTTVVQEQAGSLTRRSSHNFNADKHLIARTDALGHTRHTKRDRYGQILQQTDPLGHTTHYRYDLHGQLLERSQADGATHTLVWNALRKPTAITDALGQTVRRSYDALGSLVQSTDAQGHTTSYDYDGRGLPIRITDALGKTKQLRYNQRGQLIAYTDCSGQTTELCWNEEGQLVSRTDALGHMTRSEYQRINRRLRLVAHHLPDGSSERFAYDTAGRLSLHQDALGQRTHYQLNPAGQPLARTNALGHSLKYQYDGFGRLAALTNENGAHYRFAWDKLDRLLAEQGFDGRRIDYRYNSAGHLLEMADGMPQGSAWMAPSPKAIRTHFQRDAMGRLLERLVHQPGLQPTPGTPKRQRTRFQYDAAGQLTLARNSQARVQLHYTANGQISSEVLQTRWGQHSPLVHRYDALGHRTSTRLPDGRSLNNLHYGAGHVHQIHLDGEVICDFERDALHRETSRSQGLLASHYQLDAMGRLLASATQAQPQAQSPTLRQAQPTAASIARRYHYDQAGQLLRIDDSRSGATHYQYDAIGRLTQALAPSGNERFDFDPAHNLISPLPPQAHQGQAGSAPADSADNPGWQAQNQAQWAQYVRQHFDNPAFNPLQTSASDSDKQSSPEQWSQSNSNRLRVWQEHRYQYDRWGNCIHKKSGPRQEQHLVWDGEHQLVSVTIQNQQQQAGRHERWHYAYDPFGRRIAKWQAQEPKSSGKPPAAQTSTITHFSWDGNRLLAQYSPYTPAHEQTSAAPPTKPAKAEAHYQHRLYVYAPESFVPLAQIESLWTGDGQAKDLPSPNSFLQQISQTAQSDPAAWNQHVVPLLKKLQAKLSAQGIETGTDQAKQAIHSRILYVHTDHLGTPKELTDHSGQIVWSAHYRAWGKVEAIDYPAIRQTIQSGNTLQTQWLDQEASSRPEHNLRFQGQYADQETGLHYNRFRYYDPDCGRYLSQDPIGLYGGYNLYHYAPNPTEWVDPLGLDKKKKCYDIVPYRPTIPGLENHHGVMDVWATHNIEGYKSRASHNPTMALEPDLHDATKGIYRDWLEEKTGRRVGGKIDWTTISLEEATALSEKMFDAADVPKEARDNYYDAFEKYQANGCKEFPQ
ncbi:RHS repeat-associated core domain-containing protein [Lampropedia aestuarii]|uniref:RHS repeat-associated core domain-containing protein n=1 Tax=Lampropedia aestuarii TaxID=2562762 RepID=UPI0024687CD5|nr:RHS repeat-associated core domain-containing protein [Lampropedia aestuarii]MDH5857375.1 RHS repeat-associated core domain-containing protein [Lampropedia aestuarii]